MSLRRSSIIRRRLRSKERKLGTLSEPVSQDVLDALEVSCDILCLMVNVHAARKHGSQL